jgi:hypothetical protein
MKRLTSPKRTTRRRKIKKLSEAVLRGSRSSYNFDVLPLSVDLDDIPAVFVITRRKTDKRGRGHLAYICVGQTEFLSKEIKRHRRGKCVKQHNANAVCVLPEPNEKVRLRIEADIRGAHSIHCAAAA